MNGTIPALPDGWEPTRATLHGYARVLGAVARAHATPHPRWWHSSLEPTVRGLSTHLMALPAGGSFAIELDVHEHVARLETSDGARVDHPLDGGLSATEMGDRLIADLDALGLGATYERERFEDDRPGRYDPSHAAAFHATLTAVNLTFVSYRSELEGELGPIQVWPHGFDIAFEWFGTKRVGSGAEESPAQLNLGFYPAGRPYFYSNPWPFEEHLRDTPLPPPAQWHTDGWKGSILYHDEIAGDPDARARVVEYARSVFAAATPTLSD